MPSFRPIAVLAAAALALPVAACGDADKEKLSANQGDELLKKVDEAERALVNGGCDTIIRRAEEGITAAQDQRGVDTKLQNNIIEGFQRVKDRADLECEAEETPTPTPTPEASEEPTETPTPEETEEPTPTSAETPEPTPESTPTAEATPLEIPTASPESTGGVGFPDGEEG